MSEFRPHLLYLACFAILVWALADSEHLSGQSYTRVEVGGEEQLTYLDSTLPVEQRVADILSRMTFDEKVAQLRGDWPGVHAYVKQNGRIEIADKWKPLLSGESIGLMGATLRADPWTGVTLEKGLSRRQGAEFINTVQQFVRDHTRLGIPVLVSDDAHRGQHGIGATIFPQLSGMGATWNPSLQEEVTKAIALEMRSQGATIAFAPNLDVMRDPRYGRGDQNYGEDPWHVSEMGKAAVRGFQGDSLNSDRSVVSMLRVFPGLGDADGGHDFTGYSLGVRDLHEVVLRPWREAILEGAEGVMVEQSEMDGGKWYSSYNNLKKFAFYWDNHVFTTPRTIPGEFGARVSKLNQLLDKDHYKVKLSKDERHRINLWLDSNSDFFGSYENLVPQSKGEIVLPTLE